MPLLPDPCCQPPRRRYQSVPLQNKRTHGRKQTDTWKSRQTPHSRTIQSPHSRNDNVQKDCLLLATSYLDTSCWSCLSLSVCVCVCVCDLRTCVGLRAAGAATATATGRLWCSRLVIGRDTHTHGDNRDFSALDRFERVRDEPGLGRKPPRRLPTQLQTRPQNAAHLSQGSAMMCLAHAHIQMHCRAES